AIVELHQMVVQPHFSVSLNADELMHGAASVKTPGGSIPVPTPEKLLLMLCIHGSKHVWERLIWSYDVVLFIRAYPRLDWSGLWKYAQRCRAERMLSLGLLLAEGLAAGTMPGEALRNARSDVTAGKLARQAQEWLFLQEHDHAIMLRKSWFQVIMREAMPDRWPLLRLFGRQIFTPGPADRAAIKLPRWLGFGYYVVRPLRLAGKVIARS
ncbi:MAG: nucleotidyltransferase family protein, partial [Verrucomicrobiota bacterium]